jgi:hypothetical protein
MVCPCGPLWKWGYENTAKTCLHNQARTADALYLVHSAQQTAEAAIPAGKNIVQISGTETWFHPEGLAPDGKTFVSYSGSLFTGLHERNYRLGRLAAWLDGYRVVVYTQASWYVPKDQAAPLREAIARLVASGAHYGLLNRRSQYKNVLLRPDKAAFLIVNMTSWDATRAAEDTHDRKLQRVFVGNQPHIVDCGAEVTPQQLSEHMWRARAEVMTPEYLLGYARMQYHRYLPGDPVTDATGLAIAAQSKPEYLSNLAMRP